MSCEWLSLLRGAACIHCGYTLKRNYESAPVRRCGSRSEPVREKCPHELEPTGESVTLKNCGCGAMTAVYECELYQLCAPIPQTKGAEIIGRDDVRLCLNCEMNPSNAAS